jgi:sortase A
LTAGSAALLWCALFVADGLIAQEAARSTLAAAAIAEQSLPRPGPQPSVAPHRPTQRGTAIAALSIPRLELTAVVLEGTDARTLRRGPGHLENTAFPGEAGNVVIAGHRDSFFRPLRKIAIGDEIVLHTADGDVRYQVTSLRVVSPEDVNVLARTDRAVLTLITCYPFWVFGSAPDRYVVRAAAVGKPGEVPLAGDETAARQPISRPPVDTSTSIESGMFPVAAASDNAGLVRAAVERFRVVYNARASRHDDAAASGPLRFQSCDVSIIGDRATATCASAAAASAASESATRTFTLERAAVGWTITSIALK